MRLNISIILFGVFLITLFISRVVFLDVEFRGGIEGYFNLLSYNVSILDVPYRIDGFESIRVLTFLVVAFIASSVAFLIAAIFMMMRDPFFSSILVYASSLSYVYAAITARIEIFIAQQQIVVLSRLIANQSTTAGYILLPAPQAIPSKGFIMIIDSTLIWVSLSYMLVSATLVLRTSR
jgi:hypothetical protein